MERTLESLHSRGDTGDAQKVRIDREIETFKTWFRALPEPMIDHAASADDIEQ